MDFKKESVEFLMEYKSMWDIYKQVQVISHLPTEVSQQFLEIAKEIDPNYTGTVWCQSCLEDVIRFVYVNFEKSDHYNALYNKTEPEKIVIKTSFDASKKNGKA